MTNQMILQLIRTYQNYYKKERERSYNTQIMEAHTQRLITHIHTFEQKCIIVELLDFIQKPCLLFLKPLHALPSCSHIYIRVLYI